MILVSLLLLHYLGYKAQALRLCASVVRCASPWRDTRGLSHSVGLVVCMVSTWETLSVSWSEQLRSDVLPFDASVTMHHQQEDLAEGHQSPDYERGPRFDLGPEIQHILAGSIADTVRLITRGVPPMDVFFLLLCIPDSSVTPSAVKWCYTHAELQTMMMGMRGCQGWFKVLTLDGRDHQGIRDVIDVHTIGRRGFAAHLWISQLRASMQAWLQCAVSTASSSIARTEAELHTCEYHNIARIA